ncbi:MAG TPA: metallopeptidase TldD-related protein [Candidatus Acidoferrum sp.]|jgi:predicted Zn-dependent protease|nr:metallopeptidase TldD-related protein [Candidatus Acidoferrum sp.]
MRFPLINANRSGWISYILGLGLLAGLAFPFAERAEAYPPDAQAKRSPLLAALQAELDRSMKTYGTQDPQAYYVGYTVTDTQRVDVSGSNGALLNSSEDRRRWLEVAVRAGSYQLDDTHKVGERQMENESPVIPVPVDDDPEVLRRAAWLETDKQYRAAEEALIKIRTGKEVKVETAEGKAPDFSHEQPHVSIGPQVSINVDRTPWEAKVRAYTKAFRDSAAIINSIVTFSAQAQNVLQVTSEGTQLQYGQIRYRLELFIQGKAPDGMDIDRYYNFDWVDPKETPDDKAVYAAESTMRKELEGLVKAPIVDPTVGPALLTGRAAAVFFHEVFGHRAEGHRQKDVSEGQTFSKKVGEQILPPFLSITDDTTMKKLEGQDLLGYYQFDDEGVPSERVTLVDHGVLKNFEMSRSPLVGFPHSNGHGRRQLGATPVSRQGNLIVQSSKTMTNPALRQKFVELIKEQHKPYGLLIDDIAGGFTFTGRGQPQAFQVQPLVVYEVFPDGRPDELVRGVDIVGTPLAALTKIVATGDTPEVFNGYCGAESGSVPVAAASPAILISEMEVQKKETSTDRPPILPPPAHDVVKTGGQK